MDPTLLDQRPKIPSILTVYRPVEEYWSASALMFVPAPNWSGCSIRSIRCSFI